MLLNHFKKKSTKLFLHIPQMSELEGAFSANVPFKSNSINLIYHTSQISEFHAILNANAQLTKNRSRLFYHTSQMGEFETILNANTALKNTLNFLLPRITDKRISGYFKCKCTINEEQIKFL